MKCVELYGSDGLSSLSLIDRPDPRPGPLDVVVRVRAASLNYRDLLMTRGQYPGSMAGRPFIPLSDGAGEVVEIGPKVTRVKVGDRVAATCLPLWLGGPVRPAYSVRGVGVNEDGLLTEIACLNEQALVLLPDYMTYAEAAALPCAGVTAWHALVEGEPLRPGQTILAMGSGGVSLLAMQIAQMFGAKTIMTTTSPEKVDRLRELGAHHVINTAETPDWDAAVLELTGGQGVDCVIEVGGIVTFAKSIASARTGGRVAIIGFLAGFAGAGFDPLQILARQLWVKGVGIGHRAHFEALLEAMAAHEMHPIIDKQFSLGDFVGAYEHLEKGGHFGKIVINI